MTPWGGPIAGLTLAIAGGMMTSMVIGQIEQSRTEASARRFDAAANEVVDVVAGQLQESADVLVVASQFLSLAAPVSDEAFYAWGRTGLLAWSTSENINFVRSLRDDQLDDLVDERHAAGDLDFEVHASSVAADYFVIVSATPQPPTLPGTDLGASAERRAAFERSRDTGRPALTEPFVLVSDEHIPAADRDPAFAIYVPVYRAGLPTTNVAERRKALVGWTATAVRGPTFLDALGWSSSEVGFEVFAGAGAGLRLAGSQEVLPDATTNTRVRALDFGGESWTIRVVALDDWSDGATTPMWLMWFLGLAASGALALLVAILFGRSQHLQTSIASATDELRHERDRLSRIMAALHDGVLVRDVHDRIVSANARAAELLGVDPELLSGARPGEVTWKFFDADGTLVPLDAWPIVVARTTGTALTDVLLIVERADGTRRWVSVDAVPLVELDDAGRTLVTEVVVSFADVTARIEVEGAIRRSEAIQSASLNALEQGVALSDLGGEVLLLNRAGADMLGYSADDLTNLFRSGRWITYDLEGRELAPDQRPIRRTMDTGEPVSAALVMWETRDQRRITLRVSTQPVLAGTTVVGVVTAFSDVTTELAATRALVAAEDELRRSFNENATPMAILERNGSIRRANSAFAMLAERDVGALVGIRTRDLIHPADRHLLTYSGEKDGSGRAAWTIEHRFLVADEGQKWVRSLTSAVHDESGGVSHLVVQIEDITQLRDAQRKLDEERVRFGTLLERSSDMICVIDVDGKITYASPAGQRLLGATAGLRLGTSFSDLIHPDDIAVVTEAWAELQLVPGDVRVIEAQIQGSAGQWRHVEIVATNHLADPAIQCVVANVRDITERAEAAARLSWQAFHDGLTGLPNRALLNDRLTQALHRGRRTGDRTGLLFLDLDEFKQVNDTFGHSAGDQLLVEVAARLVHAVRATDTVARIGGDEFVILTESVVDEKSIEALARRVNKALRRPIELTSGSVEVTASIGVAFSSDGLPDSLLRDADAALYRAKARGRDRFEVFDEDEPFATREPIASR